MANQMDIIQKAIDDLYHENPDIHISVRLANLRQVLDFVPAKIVGVYNNIFQIEPKGESGRVERQSYRFCDVLIGQVKIHELDFLPPSNEEKK